MARLFRCTLLAPYYLPQILDDEQVDLLQCILHAIQPSDLHKEIEVLAVDSIEEVLLAIVNGQKALEMIGGRQTLEHLVVRGEMRARGVDDLNDLGEAGRCHSLQLDVSLNALFHAARKHGAKIIRA